MGKYKEISLEKRGAIIALRNEGLSYRKIADKVSVSLKGVQSTISRFRDTGLYHDRDRKGRPKVTTKQEDKHIVVTSKRNRRLTASEICADVNRSRENPVSLTTVKRRLRSAGLKGCVAVKKPLLRPVNKRKRLEWALQHRNWTIEQWKNVLWTDESKFEIFGSRRRIYVRRSSSEKMAPQCLVPTVKHGGGSIMVWGCFSGHGIGDLIKIDGIMKKEDYKKILVRYAIPSGRRVIGHGFVFQQDNDPKHTSRLCRRYLDKKEADGVIVNMVWPPQSPDLNPIELLWEELDRKVRRCCPTSGRELWQQLQDAWSSIQQETINKLVERLPRLVDRVIKTKGGFFDEKNV
jgi:transposase